MKNILQIFLISFSLIGCSSIDFSTVSPSATQTDKILALGLTHKENLLEAQKLLDPVLASAVLKELDIRLQESNNKIIEAENAAKYASNVKILDNNKKFIGPKVSNSRKRGLLDNFDYEEYFLQGVKNDNNNLIQHQLNLSITYSSNNRRNYYSASFCDIWEGCNNGNDSDIVLISANASGCNSSGCNYNEIVKLNLGDDLLKKYMESGLSINFNSKIFTNKIKLSPAYIQGYLKIAN